ncbi:MAG: hypothetical protein AABY22_04510 [Nanoarchaeota archaeon]
MDRTNPLISYGIGTEDSGVNVSRSNVYINVSVTEINFANITYVLRNDTATVNTTVYTSLIREINWTGLSDGNYTYNVSVRDSANNFNSTATRIINLDTTFPLITYGVGTESDNSNITRTNIYINVSITEINEANITFVLFNSTSSFNQTVFITKQRTINFTNLNDDVYTFNVTVRDYANNVNTTLTRTVRIDTINPSINFTSPTEIDGSFIPTNVVDINITATDTGVGLANITIRLYNSSNSQIQINVSITSSFYINYSNLDDGLYYFNATSRDYLNQQNNTSTRNVTIDTLFPNNTINSIQTTSDSILITVNITSSDVNLNNCFYSIFADITTLVIANTTYTCNTIISTSVNQFTSHTFYSYVNDSAGNLNQTTRNFTTTRSGNVGGGGGGASPVVITLYNFTVIYDKTWELSTSNNITIKTYDINNNFTDVDSVNIVLLNAFDNQTNISHRESIVRRIKKGEYYKEFIVDYSDKDNIQFNITVKQHTKSLQKIIGVDLVSPAIPPLFSRVEDITQTLLSRFRDYLLRNGNLLRVLYFVFLTITIISIMIYLVVKHRNNKNNNNI